MELENINFIWILLLVLWTIPWKAVALWKSARGNQKVRFVVFLLVNSLGILEIVYLFFIRKRQEK